MPRCSVVIPVFNQAALTRQCLDALLALPGEDTLFELIVVDDASTDETPRLLAGYGPRVQVVTHPTNRGFAAACNDGAAAATGDRLVFLNNDTSPRPGWLDALVDYADANPAAAVVGSKLLFPDGSVQHAGVVFDGRGYPRVLYEGFPAEHPAVNRSRRFGAVTAACMMVSRVAFEAVGGFDTAYVNGLEDIDLCLRLGERGHEVHYCHESVVIHHHMATRRGQNTERAENRGVFRRRWRGRVEPDDIRYYVEDGLLAIDYRTSYPLTFTISPLLGCTDS